MGRIVLLCLIAMLVVGVMPASAAPADLQRERTPRDRPRVDERPPLWTPASPGGQGLKHDVLASSLAAVNQKARQSGPASALAQARTAGLTVKHERVRVTIETKGSSSDQAQALVTRVGGQVERAGGRTVQAFVPPAELETIASDASVRGVYPVQIPYPAAITGEEVNGSGADDWHDVGAAGSGVKIAVIDGGFQGFEARQASGDLPPSLYTQNFCSSPFPNNAGGPHGTAVAEIVHDMAPGARLFLYCAESLTDMLFAMNDIISQGVHVIVHSRIIFNTSRGDGTVPPGAPPSVPEALVTQAHNNGILWVNAAGNTADLHWSGTYADPDNVGFHLFGPNDVGNTITIPTNRTVTVFLKWDDWPATAQDYDLYLARSSTNEVVASSRDVQDGDDRPIETLSFTNTGPSEDFYVAIQRFSASTTPRFDLTVLGNTPLEYPVAATSIDDFSASPRSMATGAACWENRQVDFFSALGPTIDGRVKPDITGLSSITTQTFGPFSDCTTSGLLGTSATAPQVGAAAALVKDANPTFNKAQLQAFLEGRAVDIVHPGKDNASGAGIVSLGALGLPGVSCTPRPNVSVQTAAQSGALVSTITANGGGNRLFRLAFGNPPRPPVNALLGFADGTANLTGTPTYYTPFGSTQTTFTSRRGAAGPMTVPLLVHDRCGAWPTFVGAGTGVGI